MSLKHVSGWLNVTGGDWGGWSPADPDYGHPVGPGWNPVDPGWGTRPPTDPGYGRPDWGGGRPDNELPGGGHIWGQGPIARLAKWLMSPHVGGGPIKPPGISTLPVDPGWGNKPPDGTKPSLPGDWLPIDPGFGKPPVWGFLPADPGFGIPETPGGGAPGGPGHWVPIDPDWGKPVGPCGGEKPAHVWGKPPLWIWIAEIGPDFGVPKPEPK